MNDQQPAKTPPHCTNVQKPHALYDPKTEGHDGHYGPLAERDIAPPNENIGGKLHPQNPQYTLTEAEHIRWYSGNQEVHDALHLNLRVRLDAGTEVCDRDGVVVDVIQGGRRHA